MGWEGYIGFDGSTEKGTQLLGEFLSLVVGCGHIASGLHNGMGRMGRSSARPTDADRRCPRHHWMQELLLLDDDRVCVTGR